MAGVGAPDIAVGVVAWLAAINLILAVFNLIPGAPLDGGRILRALLWLRHGNWVRAAVSATRAGQMLGYGLIWLGLAQFLLLGGASGLWTVFMGWFILAASRAEREHVIAEAALRGLRVRDVMTPQPQTVPAQATVADLVDHYILARPHSAYPVEETGGRIVGLVTLNQLRQVPPGERERRTVGEVAIPRDQVSAAHPDQALIPLLPQMQNDAGRMPVFEGDRLVRIMTSTDIARAIHARTLNDLSPDPRPQPQTVRKRCLDQAQNVRR